MENIVTKTHIINTGNKYLTMWSFNDNKNKYIFYISTSTIPGNDRKRRQIKRCLDIYEGADTWIVSTFSCKTHFPFISENNEIDWVSYRLGQLNYPDPFSPEFKKYAQSIVKLQAFC